ncbi:hypothetical protein [Acinetobacter baumannii]|uniref:hypothetical protein n=1 Tax=Acinetobacter baumannii TaxID=470 RepID=UPI000E5B4298|nr:hypothetical protein [Acinetobacter baumannii]MCW1490400.1 hypothetical protein [Acinetobacter baumannii]MDC4779713.1 hypothetical protein [Acinetobacter baumannii]MDC5249389.1 hypothetical protein [Acinetobacter baumannii]MDK2171263.1 hypothetical protein [Acinetobacter baumannii]MDK2182155.1 hypothetical protein [Acinetobacter baumannii]
MTEKPNKFVEEIAIQITDGDKANRLLVGNLVRFLSQKGLLDLDEYLASVEELKNEINVFENNDSENTIVNKYLDIHINDFKEPE